MIKVKVYTIPASIGPEPNERNVNVPLLPASRQSQYREQGMGGLEFTYANWHTYTCNVKLVHPTWLLDDAAYIPVPYTTVNQTWLLKTDRDVCPVHLNIIISYYTVLCVYPHLCNGNIILTLYWLVSIGHVIMYQSLAKLSGQEAIH